MAFLFLGSLAQLDREGSANYVGEDLETSIVDTFNRGHLDEIDHPQVHLLLVS